MLLASQPDKGMFLAALDYGACGYLLENASVDLVRKMLDLNDEAFNWCKFVPSPASISRARAALGWTQKNPGSPGTV